MHLVPLGERQTPLKHFTIGASLATGNASVSYSAPGTGMVYVPVYAWVSASGIGSCTYRNGTSGSIMFALKVGTGATSEITFWEDPTRMLANQPPYLFTETGIGVHEFHVWAMAVRAGAGQNALVT